MARSGFADEGWQIVKDNPCRLTVEAQTNSRSSPKEVGGFRMERSQGNGNFLRVCKEGGLNELAWRRMVSCVAFRRCGPVVSC